METWKILSKYPKYSVSNLGNIKNNQTGKYIKPKKTKTGYLQVGLYLNKKQIHQYIHRLVAIEFIGYREGLTVNHIDGDKSNNKLDNLEWLTMGDNTRHAIEIGLIDKKGEKCNFAKLTESQIIEIKHKLAQGITGVELSKEYAVSRALISMIKNNKRWRHLK